MNRKRALSLIIMMILVASAGVFILRSGAQDERRVSASTEAEESSEAVEPEPTDETKAPKKSTVQKRYCMNAHRATCTTAWPSVDPTGKVNPDVSGEIHALRSMRNLIRENPSWTSEQVQEELVKKVFTKGRRKRAEENFNWVIGAVRNLIEKQPESVFDSKEKADLLGRISLITLELPPPMAVYADAADLITKNTVYYERTPQNVLRLRIGGAYLLNTTSRFNVIYTLAHEVAHAMDPCEVQHAGIQPKAYQKLTSCFVSRGWVSKSRSTCGPEEQISEVFADWIAAEILGRAIQEFGESYALEDRARAAINGARDLCEQPIIDSLNLRAHQRPFVRIGSVIGRNALIRQNLECAPVKRNQYCRWEPVR